MFTGSLAAVLLSVQQVPADCRDDRGQDRCAKSAQQMVRDLFGVAPIQEFAARKSTVRRVFYVDGYGRDVIAIEFVRPAGGDPVVRVHYPKPRQGERPAPLEAFIGQDRWDAILRHSRNIHRTLAPLPAGQAEICLHSWVYTVEAIGPGANDPVRAVTQDACGDGPAASFAQTAADEALAVLPHCRALDADLYRNDTTVLAACHRLKGDRFAAAALLNATEGLQQISMRPKDSLAESSGSNLELDWQGEQFSGDAAKKALSERLALSDRTHFFFDEVRGTSPHEGVILGRLERYRSDLGERGFERARIELRWDTQLRGPIQSISVGPWQPVSP